MLDWINRIVRAFALWFGGFVLLALLTLTVIDVSGRYFFNWPVYGSLDLYGALLASVVAVSIPYGQRTGAHVSADVFAHLTGPAVERVIAILVRLVTASAGALWAGYLYRAGNTAGLLEESTQLLGIPFQLIYYILAVGIGLYAIVLFAESAVLIATGRVEPLVDRSQATMVSPDE
ncbi:MAG: TRAP transporter small permease [Pseudorhodoplanes sp.]|uniref:TRAP transporter small permease n=1 Tax=Pseudorhodoplanes sp. TaxID=1934341 RepID=UPI003D0F6D9C